MAINNNVHLRVFLWDDHLVALELVDDRFCLLCMFNIR